MAPLRPTQSLRPNHVCFNNKRNAEGWAIVFNFPNRFHKLLCSSIFLIFSQYRVIEGNDEIVMHCVKSQLQGEHVAGSPTTCCGSMTGCVVSLLSMRLNCFRSSRRAGVLVLPLVWCQGDGMLGWGSCCMLPQHVDGVCDVPEVEWSWGAWHERNE